jgi:hypothetical protein
MCNINKDRLLSLYFQEEKSKEEPGIENHVRHCKECRDYLLMLEQTDNALQQWKEEKPMPGILDSIMANIPEVQKKPVVNKAGLSVVHIILILFSIVGILNIIYWVHENIEILPFWDKVRDMWVVKFLGSFGVSTVLFFLVGIFLTLALTPPLILELQSKKHKYYFS